MPVLFAHLPLGLGFRRSGVAADAVPSFEDVHLLDHEELVQLVSELREGAGDAVVCSAEAVPSELLGVVDDVLQATACSLEEFAIHWSSADPALLHQAFRLSGGWPEAVAAHVGRCRPTVQLIRFLRGLQEQLPELYDLAALVACDDQPVPPEVLVEAAGTDGTLREVSIDRLESMGLVGLRDDGIELLVPLASTLLVPTSMARRRARQRLSAAWMSRDPVWAATIGSHRGGAIDEAVRQEIVAALRSAETSRDFRAWERYAAALAQLPQSEERAVGLLSSARLCLLRGRQSEAQRLLSSVEAGWCRAESEATALAVAVFGMEGGNQFLSDDTVGLTTLFPGIPAHIPDGLRVGPDGVVAERSLGPDPAGQPGGPGRAASDDEAGIVDPVNAALRIAMDAMANDYTRLRKLVDDPNLLVAQFGYMLGVLLACFDGRFIEGRSRLTLATGEDLGRIESRLVQLVALGVASGTDVTLTRELLGSIPPVPRGALGSPVAATVRAHAELMVGRPGEAWGHMEYAWCFAVRRGLGGIEAGLVADALTIAHLSDNMACLEHPSSKDLVALVSAFATGDPQEAERAAESAGPSPYVQARMMCLAADYHQRESDHEAARRLLRRAATAFSALGAPVDHARAHAQARKGGVATGDTVASSPDGADPAARLLQLVGKGLTNAEIAADLHMSTGTVKRRISELLAEHSLTNRRQLGELARARGL